MRVSDGKRKLSCFVTHEDRVCYAFFFPIRAVADRNGEVSNTVGVKKSEGKMVAESLTIRVPSALISLSNSLDMLPCGFVYDPQGQFT